MQRFRFRKGLRFLDGDRRWTLINELPTHKVQFQDDCGELFSVGKAELLRLWLEKQWSIDESCLEEIGDVIYMAAPRDLESYSESLRASAARRARYLTALAGPGFKASQKYVAARIPAVAAELNDPNPPHPTSVLRWMIAWGYSKDPRRLIDRRGRAGRRVNPTVYTMFERAVDTVFITPQKKPGRAVAERLCSDIRMFNQQAPTERQVTIPSQATIYRWLGDLNQYLVDSGRDGKRAANVKYRSVEGTVEVNYILERIEIDHTPLDLILVDEVTQVPLGRPWLTLAIDRYSRAILGFYLSFNSPSSMSVMRCLKQCVLPKTLWMSELGEFKNDWPMHGIPMQVVCDNGMDLHSDAVEKICLEFGVRVLFCPVAQPYFKGAIERAFGTLARDLIHQLPGTTFSNTQQRGDYASEKEAVLTMSHATRIITKWIVDIYHQRRHRATGERPHDRWMRRLTNTSIELPAYPEKLDALVGVPAKRQRISHEGIQFDTLLYNNEFLQDLRRRLGGRKSVDFKYFEEDTSYLQVWDSQLEHYFKVDVIPKYMAYAQGLSRQLHLVTRRWAEKTYGDDWQDENLLQARTEIDRMVTEAANARKMALRKKAAAARGVSSENPSPTFDGLKQALNPRSQPTPFPAGFAAVVENLPLPVYRVHRSGPAVHGKTAGPDSAGLQ